MAKIKISKEELQHDEFLETSETVILWIKHNSRTILLACLLAILGYAGFLGLQFQRQGKVMQANDLWAEGLTNYQFATTMLPWASDERREALQEVAAIAERVREQFAGTPIAREALYLAGDAWFSIGEDLTQLAGPATESPTNARAIDYYTRYLSEAEAPFDRAKGLLALAYAHENTAFITGSSAAYADALGFFNQVIELEEAGFLRYEAMRGAARLYDINPEEESRQQAIALRRRILEERYDPLVPIEGQDQGAMAYNAIREWLASRTLAGLARSDLQRMGIDVEREYPLMLQSN